MDKRLLSELKEAIGHPPASAVDGSRRRVREWFAQAAPLIQWDVTDSPLGALYVGMSAVGVCSIAFGVDADSFLSSLDPLAHAERAPGALEPVMRQLRAYFSGRRARFDLPLDMGRLTPFQRTVLQTARTIPPGAVWTYAQVARAIGRPRASRAVGQALSRNPIPIVIPCHRVIGSDGGLHGYSAPGGLESKRWPLQFEGAL